MNKLLALALSVGLALPYADASAADADRNGSIEDIAEVAFYDFCPRLLADEFSFSAPELAELGFSTKVETQSHPRFGKLKMVALERPDGTISFNGAAANVCSVLVFGERRASALARLRDGMRKMGLDFRPAPYEGPQVPGLTVENFRAKVDGQTVFVQLLQAGGPTPMVTAQMIAMED